MLAIGNRELTPVQRLSKAVVAVMSHDRYKALAPVLMIGERKWSMIYQQHVRTDVIACLGVNLLKPKTMRHCDLL